MVKLWGKGKKKKAAAAAAAAGATSFGNEDSVSDISLMTDSDEELQQQRAALHAELNKSGRLSGSGSAVAAAGLDASLQASLWAEVRPPCPCPLHNTLAPWAVCCLLPTAAVVQ